jgi:hypothetical protein
MFVTSCDNNAAATMTARHNNKKMMGTNGLETMLMATGKNDQLWEEATTTGRRDTPMTTTPALLMEEEDVVTMPAVMVALHICILRCSGRRAGRGWQ